MKIQLPENFSGELDVKFMKGKVGNKTWTLYSVETGQLYEISPDTIKNWHLPKKREESRPNSIIISFDKKDVLALELTTGKLYRTSIPS